MNMDAVLQKASDSEIVAKRNVCERGDSMRLSLQLGPSDKKSGMLMSTGNCR